MQHHCEFPSREERFYNVYKCPVCKQWWKYKYAGCWCATSLAALIFYGYLYECRSFIRHNKKGAA